jgi:hypothetical protein
MLVFDGEEKTRIKTDGNRLSLYLRDRGIEFTAVRSKEERHKKKRQLFTIQEWFCRKRLFDVTGNQAVYRISPN